MGWRPNSPLTRPPYQTPCWIHTRDGKTLEAELIKLNPRYHKKAGSCDRWKVRGKKKAYVDNDAVVEWRLALDI